jgi:hypothetical protein
LQLVTPSPLILQSVDPFVATFVSLVDLVEGTGRSAPPSSLELGQAPN